MPIDEAQCSIKPRYELRSYKASQKRAGSYLVLLWILVALSTVLCINLFFMHKAYGGVKQQYDAVIQSSKVLDEDKKKVKLEREAAAKENIELKEQYEEIKRENQEILKQIQQIKVQNNELVQKNKDLVEDNIALQNSLKKAASVGAKPQNFTRFNGLSSRSALDRGRYIGKFLGTAYTPSHDECGNSKGITNSGKPIIPGVSIAVDTKFWPFGTVLYIKGLGYAVAMDKGSAIKGKYRFDFAVFDKKLAYTLGQKQWDVYLVKLGNGKVGDIKL